MKLVPVALFCGFLASVSLAEEVVVPEEVDDCIKKSAVVKLAIAEFFDMGDGTKNRFPKRDEFEQLSALNAAGECCAFVYVDEGVFDIDMDEQLLGFGASIQPRITATPREPYQENLMIDFNCSRGQTAEADLQYLPEPCRGEN